MTRVSTRSLSESLVANLQLVLRQIVRTQEQLVTGKRINTPSDDPVGVARLMSYKSGLRSVASEEEGLEAAGSWLAMVDQIVGQLVDLGSSARASGLAAISATNEDVRESLAEQVDAAVEQAVELANSRLRGRYMFSGTATQTAPVECEGSYAFYRGSQDPLVQSTGSGALIEVSLRACEGICAQGLTLGGDSLGAPVSESTTLASLGATPGTLRVSLGSSAVSVDCSGATTVGDLLDALEGCGLPVTAQVSASGQGIEVTAPTGGVFAISDESGNAAEVLGVAGSVEPDDLIGCLIRLRDAIRGGDADEITEATAALEGATDRLTVERGRVGARQQRVELALTRAQTAATELERLESALEDADLAELATRLQLAQSVYQAALGSLAVAMEHSLADFL